jgi:GNAT superfamily N-acetyltransferase
VRIWVEQSPSGAWFVRAQDADAPLARCDTEDEARAKAFALSRAVAADAAREAGSAEPAAAAGGEPVTLRDGSRVLVRQVRPQDKPLFERGIARLGHRSRYQRFLSIHPPSLSPEELVFFTEVDHADHEAIGAIDEATGEGVAVARYMRLPAAPEVAEAAITVLDEWQGRGLGTVLGDRLAALAELRGITRFTATLFATNRAMAHVFAHLGTVREAPPEAGVVEVDVDLPVRGLAETMRAVAASREAEGG